MSSGAQKGRNFASCEKPYAAGHSRRPESTRDCREAYAVRRQTRKTRDVTCCEVGFRLPHAKSEWIVSWLPCCSSMQEPTIQPGAVRDRRRRTLERRTSGGPLCSLSLCLCWRARMRPNRSTSSRRKRRIRDPALPAIRNRPSRAAARTAAGVRPRIFATSAEVKKLSRLSVDMYTSPDGWADLARAARARRAMG